LQSRIFPYGRNGRAMVDLHGIPQRISVRALQHSMTSITPSPLSGPSTTASSKPVSVAQFLAQFPRVDSYAEIEEVLRSPDFIQGSHFESKPVFGGSLVVTDGPEHRQRRRTLMAMFSHEALQRNERELLAPAIRHAFEHLKNSRGADGLVRLDLVALLRGLTIQISASVTGVDGADDPGRRAHLQALVARLEAASGVEWSTRDKDEVMQEGIAAQRELIRDFLQPALDRRIELVRRHRAGALQKSDLPADLLAVLAEQGEDGRGGEEDPIWRECALFLVAGTQTTSHAIPHVLWHLDQWWAQHTDQRERATDIEFLRAAANESLRLHQPVPALLRMALNDVTLKCSGRSFKKGDRVALHFSSANREAESFGDAVETFNPMRPFSKKPPPWGLTFGSGAHTCIGRALVTGLSRRYDDTDPTYGTIVGVLRAVYEAGATLDPDDPPRRNTDSFHDAFASMPVVLRHL
jgi:cytochrome P450